MPVRTRTLAAALVTSSTPALAQCEWRSHISQGAAPPSGLCATLYNPDGSGPLPLMLVVGGSTITAAGLSPASNIAAYDGTQWSTFGLGLTGGSGSGASVRALTVYNGDLIAAGDFTAAGGLPAQRIARWNGAHWSALGNGLNAPVYALAVFNTQLYAGGEFTTAGGAPVNRIARWNGSSWNAVGSGISGGAARINAMAAMDANLYIGGEFTSAGGLAVSNFARWNGSTWSNPGNVNGPVYGMAAHMPTSTSGSLYMTGSFTNVAGVSANNVARFSGLNPVWSAMGPGLPGSGGKAMLVRGTGLNTHEVLATAYETHGRVLRWTGSVWNDVGPGWGPMRPDALSFYGGRYIAVSYLGSSFYDAQHNTWAALGPGFESAIADVAPFESDLYFAGSFRYVNNQRMNSITRWDGDTFHPLDTGLIGSAHALLPFQSDLWVGGSFSAAGSIPTRAVARWDGSAWHAAALPAGSIVNTLTVHNNQLYAGGQITGGGAQRWTGVSWTPAGGNFIGEVYTLKSYGGHLFAGGILGMSNIGGVSSPLARLDPSTSLWSSVPMPTTNPNGRIDDLEEFQGSLYIGGFLLDQTAPGPRPLCLLRLDSPTGAPQTITSVYYNVIGSTSPQIRQMHIYNGELHLSGVFDRAGGQIVNNFAKFDGTNWSGVGAGLRGATNTFTREAMTVFNHELIIAGGLERVGANQISREWARWYCPEPCYPNCDNSTTPPILNVDDFTCFINNFAAAQQLPHNQQITHDANCDGSTIAPALNVDDFTCFINAFAQGCN